MDRLNQSGNAGYVFLIFVVLCIAFVLWNTQRVWSQSQGRKRESFSEEPPEPRILAERLETLLNRCEVKLHETARDLSAQLDTKLALLTELIYQANLAAKRLEAAIHGPSQPNPAGSLDPSDSPDGVNSRDKPPELESPATPHQKASAAVVAHNSLSPKVGIDPDTDGLEPVRSSISFSDHGQPPPTAGPNHHPSDYPTQAAGLKSPSNCNHEANRLADLSCPSSDPVDTVAGTGSKHRFAPGSIPASSDATPRRCEGGASADLIYLLADYGFDASEIAVRTGMPVGEVELILNLRPLRAQR